jgi:hypothetical protein
MRICIYAGNHGNGHGIADLVCLLRNGVRDCGYDVCVSHVLLKDHCNILIENFVEDADRRHLLESKTPGTRYILVGTELITGSSFNAGLAQNDWHYSNGDYWKRRYEGFMLATRLADAIWVLGESVIDSYVAAVPDKPVRFLPHGYVEGFDQVQHRDEADKDIDFYFSGSMTQHRLDILNALNKDHVVAFNGQASPDYLRIDLMARAKVCLSLRLSPDNELPSVSRMHFHIQNRNYLVHERYAGTCRLDPYVLHAPSDDFVEWARAALEVTNRREAAGAALARFKAEMPMARWMRPLLDEAIGELGPARAAPLRLAA